MASACFQCVGVVDSEFKPLGLNMQQIVYVEKYDTQQVLVHMTNGKNIRVDLDYDAFILHMRSGLSKSD